MATITAQPGTAAGPVSIQVTSLVGAFGRAVMWQYLLARDGIPPPATVIAYGWTQTDAVGTFYCPFFSIVDKNGNAVTAPFTAVPCTLTVQFVSLADGSVIDSGSTPIGAGTSAQAGASTNAHALAAGGTIGF
jgi:hypothetical protein